MAEMMHVIMPKTTNAYNNRTLFTEAGLAILDAWAKEKVPMVQLKTVSMAASSPKLVLLIFQ